MPATLTPKRRAIQWLLVITALTIPFIEISSGPLLRMDFAAGRLHLFGITIASHQILLLLPLTLALILLFVLITIILGRAWCGWFCPQTLLMNISEYTARRLGLQVKGGNVFGNAWRKTLFHLTNLILALLVSANLVWYFLAPATFFQRLLSWELGAAATMGWLLSATTIFISLSLLRRTFCTQICPYGRFQTTLLTPTTLTLQYHPAHAHRCIRCNACVRACPTGIDIREGYQIECINCGNCLDACRQVMARKNESDIIRYTFGIDDQPWPKLFSTPVLLIGSVFLIATTAFVTITTNQSDTSLTIRRSATIESRLLSENRQITFYTARIANRSQHERTYQLRLAPADQEHFHLPGIPPTIIMSAGENREITIALQTATPPPKANATLQLVQDGDIVHEMTLRVVEVQDQPQPHME
ncbi:4Fe-4S binding protein [Desulfurispirillum indicum]|uniref:4Fe-4S dicluster domain-containing protein n=1 Tax=Desulfurispirillum indicum TaxID=936456 RepID=UPI001CFB3621|nr:4Fe-4S dicluster domain-containing protein [Desulfurispirillum indicum]UCZ56183.1 4Fe-4S binding protein [Desulfurispirillum indicum]